jgi:hypothetical protein
MTIALWIVGGLVVFTILLGWSGAWTSEFLQDELQNTPGEAWPEAKGFRDTMTEIRTIFSRS